MCVKTCENQAGTWEPVLVGHAKAHLVTKARRIRSVVSLQEPGSQVQSSSPKNWSSNRITAYVR